MLNTTNWRTFFTEFAKLPTSPEAREPLANWAHFFESFAELWHPQTPQPRVHIPLTDWVEFINDFAREHGENRKQGRAIDVWQIVELGHKELVNSTILRWLLDCHGSHGQGAAFLQALLACSECRSDIMTSTHYGYRTTLEKSYDEHELNNDKQRSRVDITLEGPAFLLLIEVKVEAGETDNQLKRYLHIGRERAGVRPWHLVYLTKDGRPPDNTELKNATEIVCVRWRDLGRAFLRHTASMPADSHGTVIIRQFCEHIINL